MVCFIFRTVSAGAGKFKIHTAAPFFAVIEGEIAYIGQNKKQQQQNNTQNDKALYHRNIISAAAHSSTKAAKTTRISVKNTSSVRRTMHQNMLARFFSQKRKCFQRICVVCYVCSCRKEKGGKSMEKEKMQKAIDYIEENLKTEITADELAQMAGYSVFHFCSVPDGF